MLKKIFFVLLLFLVVGCSKDKVFVLEDYLEDTTFVIELQLYGKTEYLITLDDMSKDAFLEEIKKLSIVEYGEVERGAGGYGYRLVCGNVIVEDNNGAHLFVDGVELTNKQSCWQQDSLANLVNAIVEIQDDEVYALINTVNIEKAEL
ncbi:MAG: hypothetical protein IJO78_07565 [Erysipelotrichaceae bacterium]|nr:hypothetical protein [Erysipelotrichaceae bacterium]